MSWRNTRMLALQNVCDACTCTRIHWWWLPCYAQFFLENLMCIALRFTALGHEPPPVCGIKCSTHVYVSFFRESFPLISSCHRSNIMRLDITDQSRQCKTHQRYDEIYFCTKGFLFEAGCILFYYHF